MSKVKNSSVMGFVPFSRYLLESGDIDPDYMFIREFWERKKWSMKKMMEWLMLKVVVYDSVSELEHLIFKVPLNELRFGAERRKSKNHAGEYLANIKRFFGSDPVRVADQLCIHKAPLKEIQNVKGFGAWAAWKLMDLIHCCASRNYAFNRELDFREAYDFPLKGLLMVNEMEENVTLLNDNKVYTKCMDNVWRMLKPLHKVRTPHNGFCGLRLNEVETLLCKYHSYMHGKYHPGEDIERLLKNIKTSPYPEINKFPNLW